MYALISGNDMKLNCGVYHLIIIVFCKETITKSLRCR